MICNKCGMQVRENSLYCTNCGNKIERVNNINNVFDSSNFNANNNTNINTLYNQVQNTYSNYQENVNKELVAKENIINNNQIQNSGSRKFDWKTPLKLFIFSILLFVGVAIIRIIINVSLSTPKYWKYKESILSLLNVVGYLIPMVLFISSIVVFIVKLVKYSSADSKTVKEYTNTVINSDASLDDRLLMAYVGDNYLKIKNKKFSVPSFFLSYLYTSYRKYYLLTFIIFLITTISVAFNEVLFYIIYIIMDVVVALNFNKWYLKNAEKSIKKIKDDNPSLNEDDLVMLCSKKGKPSVGTSIICLLIYSFVTSIIRTIIGG